MRRQCRVLCEDIEEGKLPGLRAILHAHATTMPAFALPCPSKPSMVSSMTCAMCSCCSALDWLVAVWPRIARPTSVSSSRSNCAAFQDTYFLIYGRSRVTCWSRSSPPRLLWLACRLRGSSQHWIAQTTTHQIGLVRLNSYPQYKLTA